MDFLCEKLFLCVCDDRQKRAGRRYSYKWANESEREFQSWSTTAHNKKKPSTSAALNTDKKLIVYKIIAQKNVGLHITNLKWYDFKIARMSR